MWCTSNEFIDIMAGDWEEHATLLCTFFNYIFDVHKSKMKAYLVFGRGIPEGNTVYTMTAAPGEDGGFTKPKVCAGGGGGWGCRHLCLFTGQSLGV